VLLSPSFACGNKNSACHFANNRSSSIIGICAELSGFGRPASSKGETTNTKGSRSTARALGAFPQGCRWRAVSYAGEQRQEWAVREYEYWQDETASWGSRQPKGCYSISTNNTIECLSPPSVLRSLAWQIITATMENIIRSNCVQSKYLAVDHVQTSDDKLGHRAPFLRCIG
jgi:hypothetical protein